MAICVSDLIAYASATSVSAEEVSLRSSVSRAYYAAYHAARIFHEGLSSPGIVPPQEMGLHETLFYRLVNPSMQASDPSHLKSKQIGYKAKGLKPYRVKADYELAETVNADDMAHVIEESWRIVLLCE